MERGDDKQSGDVRVVEVIRSKGSGDQPGPRNKSPCFVHAAGALGSPTGCVIDEYEQRTTMKKCTPPPFHVPTILPYIPPPRFKQL